MATVPLKGSERSPPPGAQIVAPADPNERLDVSVLIRRRAVARDAITRGVAGARRSVRRFLEPRAIRADAWRRARGFCRGQEVCEPAWIDVRLEHAGRRTMILSGTVAQFSALSRCSCIPCGMPRGCSIGAHGHHSIAGGIGRHRRSRAGLDNRPQAKPHFRCGSDNRKKHATACRIRRLRWLHCMVFRQAPAQVSAWRSSSWAAASCKPISIPIFQRVGRGLADGHAVSVDHAENSPTGDADGPDGEVMLDIEVVGAIAPQAKIAVYFAPNTDAGFLDAITTAIHDTTNKPSVISISWGGPESTWTSQAMTAMDEAFQAAATMGITVCVASGDNGSSDGVSSGDHVDFPASSSFALACGGTSLHATPAAHHQRSGVERRRQRRRERRRHQHLLRLADLAGGIERDQIHRQRSEPHHARRARCGGRCGSGNGLRRARRRLEYRDRRHQRGCAAMGGV
jgi:kumamolisin